VFGYLILLAFIGPEYRGRAMDGKEDGDLARGGVPRPISDDGKEIATPEESV
jgi:hypothetical protein